MIRRFLVSIVAVLLNLNVAIDTTTSCPDHFSGGQSSDMVPTHLLIYGSINLTKDRVWLKRASERKKVIDLAVAELENSELPEQVAINEPETVKSPFA